MTNTTITNARANLFQLAGQVTKLNDIVNISTKDGNVIMMSEDDYNSLMETVYIHSIPGLAKSIIEAKNAPREEFTEIDWRKELE
jgi:PHD/YefM family antitoxin component YafN of YafNO toxin-antitoxin module